MIEQLTISIPVELATHAVWQRALVNRYHTNAVIKALDTYLVLKAVTTSGHLQQWNKQKQDLFTVCKVTESVFRHRLKLLQDLKLVSYNRHDIKLCSWDQLAVQLEIDVTNRFTLQYKINDTQRVQEWIIATEISDNKNRQAYKVLQKLDKNPDHKNAITTAIVKAGADRAKLKDRAYYLSWLNILYRADFLLASDIHHLLILYRPDTNRGVKKMAEHWKAKHPTTVSYWKKVLKSSGILSIDKLIIESTDRVRNAMCRVLWLKQRKQTALVLCDQITILTPWILPDNANNTDFSFNRLSA